MMAEPVLQNTDGQSARMRATLQLYEIFGSKNLNQLTFFSDQISAYLTDYFVLVKDLEKEGDETPRKAYHDYSFVIVPVQKSLEAYLKNLFEFPFVLAVSKKRGERIGDHLNISEEAKKSLIEKASRLLLLKFTTDKWVEMWEGLGKEWEVNRNKLTHVDEERVESIQQAIMAASSIIRWMKISSDLVMKELVNPLIDRNRAKREKEKLSAYSPSISASPSPSASPSAPPDEQE